MTSFLDQVAEFHAAFKYRQPEPLTPDLSDAATNELRPKLIREELFELLEAVRDKDRIGQLDALCDIQYVLSGAVMAWGLRKSIYPVELPKPVNDTIHHIALMFGENAQMEISAKCGYVVYTLRRVCILQAALDAAIAHLGFRRVFSKAFTEVHRSNLTKLWSRTDCAKINSEDFDQVKFEISGDKYICRRVDGKIIKSPSYSPASLKRFV